MSLLKKIDINLQLRNDLVFSRESRDYFKDLKTTLDRIGQEYNYYIAPKKGLFESETLQTFMLSLIPDLKAEVSVPFKQDNEFLFFGRLGYHEEIMKIFRSEKIETVLLDSDLNHVNGFIDNRKVQEKRDEINIMRVINLMVFPTDSLAADYKDHKLPSRVNISFDDLYKKYKT